MGVRSRGGSAWGGFYEHKDMNEKTAPCCQGAVLIVAVLQRGLAAQAQNVFESGPDKRASLFTFDNSPAACGVSRQPFQKATATRGCLSCGFEVLGQRCDARGRMANLTSGEPGVPPSVVAEFFHETRAFFFWRNRHRGLLFEQG